MSQSQVTFSNRSDLVAAIHANIDAVTSQISATESEIRSLQHEQAERADGTQTRQRGYPHPQSKAGRDNIRSCRDQISFLNRKRSRLMGNRRSLREDARYQENIVASSNRPVRSAEPMRKL
ncbi:MAG: hypothetical protein DRI24_17010 [Deltaproteobacteria bacterium]|nr:MAG: hypothetical protein DRI24_17010 [Deltaproteobacteria bacterium]